MQNKKDQHEQMMLMITDWQSSGLKQRVYCNPYNSLSLFFIFSVQNLSVCLDGVLKDSFQKKQILSL